jgi:predicted GNAT family N-acyltransferase
MLRLQWVAHHEPEMARLYALRHEVFVLEQRVPVELERDDHDLTADHLAAWREEDGRLVGVLRVVALPSSPPASKVAKIGRVAVPQDMRGRGVAAAMMREALERARSQGFDEAYLHAQWDARGLYERLGFVPEGDTFDDAGILHIAMRRRL